MNSISKLDAIALSHGQARWLLTECLDLWESKESAYEAYLKYLRKCGVPFAPEERPGGSGVNIVYRYHHLMELVLALVLHRQAILKGNVVTLIADLREELRPLFRQAWLERDSGLGAKVPVKVGTSKPYPVSGLWLDLQLRYLPGDEPVLTTTGPVLLGPEDAIKQFSAIGRQRLFRDLIYISEYAADVVRLAPEAPAFRRGRK